MFAHDVTDKIIARQTAENCLRQKTQFLCQVSHEIRTPMVHPTTPLSDPQNGIIGIAHILLDTKLPQEISENIQIIFNSASTLLNMLNNVLDFSKIETGNRNLTFVSVDLAKILSNSINVFQAGARIKGNAYHALW
jgi:signal transduction histidine kinase